MFYVSVCNLDLPVQECVLLILQNLLSNGGVAVSDIPAGQNFSNWFAKHAMAACCIIMLAPVALVLLSGASIGTMFPNAGLMLPLVTCLAMHFVRHRA